MKRNVPNVASEIPIPPEEILVSRTDTKGRITYINSAFAEISGYSPAELIGSSHNIVRHPEVPPAVFQDMWDTLKRGEPWRGIVKNRAKSGRYYWVDALVCPTFQADRIVGYVSVRKRAQRDQVTAAEQAYAAVNAGKPLHPWWVRMGLDRFLSIRNGIVFGILAVLLMFLAGAAYTVHSIRVFQQAHQDMYRQQVDGADGLRRIKFLMSENRSQVMLALLHDPAAPFSAHHDHPLESHFQEIAHNRQEIERLWQRFNDLPVSPGLRHQANTYWLARQRYVSEGLQPAMTAMAKRHNYLEAHGILIGLQEKYREANTQVDLLIQHIQQEAESNQKLLTAHYEQKARYLYLAILMAVILFPLGGVLFFRGIMRPLEQSIASLTRVARGDLSQHPIVQAQGETRQLTHALAISQAQLHAILDQLSQNAVALSADAALLNNLVRRIADGTDEQHERVHLMNDKMTETAQAMAQLSEQAESMTGNAEHARTVLDMTERDVTDFLARMQGLAEQMRAMREQVSAVTAACQSGDSAPAPGEDEPAGDPQARPTQHRGQALQSIAASLDSVIARIDAEQQAMLGLESLSRAGWDSLKTVSAELSDMARELAISTRLQFFAAEDARRDMSIIADFLVNNRGASLEIWSAARQVLELATAMEELTGNFNFAASEHVAQANK